MTFEIAARNGLRACLKERTARPHRQLENDLDLMNPALSLDRYRLILARFLGFYESFESIMRTLPDAELAEFARSRAKVPWLRQDLEYFGMDPDAQPRCRRMPPLRTVAEGLGGLYVVEGATLGGQFVFRHVRDSWGVTPETGGRFYYGYAEGTSRAWKAFEDLLERRGDAASTDETVESASETFRILDEWFLEGR